MLRKYGGILKLISFTLISTSAFDLRQACAETNNVEPPVALTGSGTIVFRHRSHFLCNQTVLAPFDSIHKNIPTSNDHILMDWEYGRTISNAHETAGVGTSSCDLNGNFQFTMVTPGNYALFVHFHWLRGKWASGGCLVREVKIENES